MAWGKFELENEVELFMDKLELLFDLRARMVDISTDLGKWRINEEEAVKKVNNLIDEFEPHFQPNTIGLGVSQLKEEIDGVKNFDIQCGIVYSATDYEIVKLTEQFSYEYQMDKILKRQFGESYWSIEDRA